MEHDQRRHGSGGPERQITLFGEAGFTTESRTEERGSKPLTIEERFEIFHAENPAVYYVEFLRVAREEKAKSKMRAASRVGADALEFALWHPVWESRRQL